MELILKFLYSFAPILNNLGSISLVSVYYSSPAVKPPVMGEACIRVRIKYFYSFMTFGPY